MFEGKRGMWGQLVWMQGPTDILCRVSKLQSSIKGATIPTPKHSRPYGPWEAADATFSVPFLRL